MKEDGVYLIARIVTFKDKNLASYGKGKYAVWDKALNRPWIGISGYEKVKDEDQENGDQVNKAECHQHAPPSALSASTGVPDLKRCRRSRRKPTTE